MTDDSTRLESVLERLEKLEHQNCRLEQAALVKKPRNACTAKCSSPLICRPPSAGQTNLASPVVWMKRARRRSGVRVR